MPSSEITIHSVAFAYPGNREAIPMRAPATDRLISEHAEWISGERSAPAAYVRGARPHVQATFRRAGGAGRVTLTVRATGIGGSPGISARRVRLVFDKNGQSQPVRLQFSSRLPRSVGIRTVHWRWGADLDGRHLALGSSRHEVCLTWRRPRPAADWATTDAPDVQRAWVYVPVMQWTCAWAARRTDPLGICNAILAGLPRSGLKYARPAWAVRDMLTHGGGYCGGWYRMFQAMAGAQGVRVERRAFLVDWQAESRERARWCAIVVENPGINRTEPAEAASIFHDVRRRPAREAPVRTVTRPRYRFWGVPGHVGDGHCINFLRHRGTWYLFDACFLRESVPLPGFTLPRSDSTRPVMVKRLGEFRRRYLDCAVNYMLGSLWHARHLYRTEHPDPSARNFGNLPTINGLSVRTDIVHKAGEHISFYWV